MNAELPKDYNCTSCGRFHEFPAYVYAHWRDVLAHKCEGCGQEHEIICGAASKPEPERKKGQR